MAIVQSFGAVRGPRPQNTREPAYGATTWALTQPSFSTYAAIYRTQPNVRTVVDFLARNTAQLGVHVFRRLSDTDRQRLVDHELAQWLKHPNPATTQYRLIESLMQDLGIYYTAYWLKIRGDKALGLLRLPPETVEVYGWLMPQGFVWTRPDGTRVPLAPSEVVYFYGYDPLNPITGLSPLETLRRVLAEECASTAYREAYWKNAARLEGVIERPLAAPRWNADQKQTWREQWQNRFAGPGKAGQVAVLEDGMTFKPTSFSARESEFTAARKLTREEVAAEYHIPLPMVGILDHATFSNIKEQHKQLYQDCLGPWLRNLQDEFERQILPDCDDQKNVYTEFNIAEKLKGSFEEQGATLQTLCGRPIMTGNEGRARLNLPSMKDDPTMDEVVFSLNTASPNQPGTKEAPQPLPPAKSAALTLIPKEPKEIGHG
jgi:HK97 family phage portal protein